MQVNRLSQLSFLPATSTVTSGPLDAEAQGTSSGAAVASRARGVGAISQEPVAGVEPSAEASVKLDLEHSQRAQAPVTYGPDGLFAGKSGVEVANTPAERFVASAVDIMRTYGQEQAKTATQGPFDRIRQAMSRFSVQA